MPGAEILEECLSQISTPSQLIRALEDLKSGKPVLLYDSDGREQETDMIFASQFVTPGVLSMLRREVGGLICTAIPATVHEKLGLPFAVDMLSQFSTTYPVLAGMGDMDSDLKYDKDKVSFGITLNHRKTFTGITDLDRSLTIRELSKFIADLDTMSTEDGQTRFGQEFRAPGHVILLNGASGGLAQRQGHTELSLELVQMAGLIPSSTLCEMLDSSTGKALTRDAAVNYAIKKNLVFLNGSDVVRAKKAC